MPKIRRAKKTQTPTPIFLERKLKAQNPFVDEKPTKYQDKNTPFVILPIRGLPGPGNANPVFSPRTDIKWDLHKDGVTYSLLSTFLQCPEKLKLQYGRLLSGARISGALAFGSVFHEALDFIYSSKKVEGKHASVGDVLYTMEERDKNKLQENNAAPTSFMELEENYGLAEVVLEAYMDRWQKEHASIGEWVALEEKFCVPYSPAIMLGLDIPDIPMRGKRDGMFRTKGGSLWLFETKTKGRIEDESILDTLGFNLQNHIYIWTGEKDYGEEIGGVLYNLVRRPQLKMGVKETLKQFLNRVKDDIYKRPDFYFMRYNLSMTRDEKRAWLRDFNGIMWRLIMWYYGQYHYRDNGACSGRMGICEYLPICGQRNIAMNSYRERESVFPELEATG